MYPIKHRYVSPEVEAVTKVLADYIAVGTDNSLQFTTFRPREFCTVELCLEYKFLCCALNIVCPQF